MPNIQECTELSHIPVSVWAEKNLLWEAEHEFALKRKDKNVSCPQNLSHMLTGLYF
jgi:hypothetical protein